MSRVLVIFLLLASTFTSAQTLSTRPDQPAPSGPPMAPNSDGTYQALRHVTVGSEAIQVSNWTLKRDGGTFTFRTGTFTLLAPVNGKVTGAVFQGDGSLQIEPPIAIEKGMLSLLTTAPCPD